LENSCKSKIIISRMKKNRGNRGWIYGAHSVRAVLEARPGDIVEMLVAAQAARTKFAAEAARMDVAVREASKRELDLITGTDSHQGVAVKARLPDYAELSEIIGKTPHVLVVLDGITDPQNMGAIVRSAEALGASGVIIGKDRSAGMSAAAHKASAGALEWIPVCRVTNISRTLRELKESGYWIYGADPEGGNDVYSVDFSEKVCLVIGSEGRGVRPGVKSRVDFAVKIIQKGRTKSLNASAACAILLGAISRTRK
jgi:23S rRNA (guanosine2251-2'-O)-methyltransferase